MSVVYPCTLCNESVQQYQIHLSCVSCYQWFHVRCLQSLNLCDYNNLSSFQKSNWSCYQCQHSYDSEPRATVVQEILSMSDDDVHESRYCTPEDFNTYEITSDYPNSFLSLHLNCRSLSKNYEQIESLLLSLKHPVSVLALTETWLSNDSCKGVGFDGYVFESKVRIDKRGGGVALAIKSDIRYFLREDLNVFDENFESLFIEVVKRGKNLIIGVLYRPPNQSTLRFLERLKDLLPVINNEHKELILMGDFNIDLMKLDNLSCANELLELFYSFYLYPLINKPTRVTDTSATLIDNIFSNNSCIFSCVLTTEISDHLPILALFDYSNVTCYNNMYRHEITDVNINIFVHELSLTNFDDVLFNTNDPNYSYKRFTDTFCKIYNECFPLKKYFVKKTVISHGSQMN